MTNREKIQNMTTEELAEFMKIDDFGCQVCAYSTPCIGLDCFDGYKKWLESEVEEK